MSTTKEHADYYFLIVKSSTKISEFGLKNTFNDVNVIKNLSSIIRIEHNFSVRNAPGRSLIYIKNKSAPKIKLGSTPTVKLRLSDRVPLTQPIEVNAKICFHMDYIN